MIKDIELAYSYLILRKDSFFKNDKRFIVDYKIIEHRNNLELTIGSTEWVK